MTNFQRLLVTTAASALFAVSAQPGKPGGTSGPPSKVPVIADFSGHMKTFPEGLSYKDENLSGGWSRMPGTGNFTLQLDGGKKGQRELEMNFSDSWPPGPDGSVPNGANFYYDGNPAALIPLFLSMNRICAVNEYDPVTQHCGDPSTSEGSLKAMTFGGPDLLVNFRSSFPDPLDSKSTLKVHCGPDGYASDLNELGFNPPDTVRATCVKGREGDDACLEWLLTPYTGDGSLRCRALRQTSVKGSLSYTDLGLYNMPFSVILQRDENGDGMPDH